VLKNVILATPNSPSGLTLMYFPIHKNLGLSSQIFVFILHKIISSENR